MKRGAKTRAWLIQATSVLSSILLLGSVAGSAYFWGLVAYPQRAGLLAELKVMQSAAPGAHDPPPVKDLAARLQKEQALIAALAAKIPQNISTIRMTDAIFQAARQAGVSVEAVSFGTTGQAPIQGFREASATVTILAGGPLATVRFLEALSQGSPPATASIGSLSLLPGPQTVTVSVAFIEQGSGA